MIGLVKTYESIESYVKNSIALHRLLHTDWIPGHSVIERGMKQLSLSYIRRVNRRIIWGLRRRGMIVGVDSTGFSLSTSSKWFDIRIRRENTKKDYLKLHIVIDVKTGVIHYFTITRWNRGDSMEFKRLLRYLPKVAKVLGDKAYSSRKNCEIVVSKGGKPYLMFKVNATGKSKGSPGWKESFHEYKTDKNGWLTVYHLRSIVESVFGSIKRRWNGGIRSRKGWARRIEVALKVLAYNIKQTLCHRRAAELGIDLWIENH